MDGITWTWEDGKMTSERWVAYQPADADILERAYQAGKSTVTLNSGRYEVGLNSAN